MLVAVALVVALFLNPLGPGRTIEYGVFLKAVEANNLKKVTFVGKDRLIGEVKDAQHASVKDQQLTNGRFSVSLPAANDRTPLIEKIREGNPDVSISSEEEHGAWIGPLLTTLLTSMLLLGVLFLFILPRFRDPLGGSFLNNYIKSPARRYERSKGRITFEDVADMESAKRELQEVVDFLRSPD
jgi:cell division protease FtsH